MTGYRRASDGKYILMLTTYHSTSCVYTTASTFQYCSVLLAWDATTTTGNATVVLAPAANYALVGAAWAPTLPSPTPSPSQTGTTTPSGTPSNSPTPTASGTLGSSNSRTATAAATTSNTASVSATASDSPSPSLTPTSTASPTASPSFYPAFGGVPFTPGNLVVLRIGDGAALTTTGTAGVLQEINPVSGGIVQTIPLPTVSGAVNGTQRGACTFYGSTAGTTDVVMSSYANKLGLAIGCYNTPLGAVSAAKANN